MAAGLPQVRITVLEGSKRWRSARTGWRSGNTGRTTVCQGKLGLRGPAGAGRRCGLRLSFLQRHVEEAAQKVVGSPLAKRRVVQIHWRGAAD